MKKTLVIILCIVAIPLYGYNALLLLRTVLPGSGKPDRVAAAPHFATLDMLERIAAPVTFSIRGRDPFTLATETVKPAATALPATRKEQPKKEVVLPSLSVSGILWNPANPVAMLRLADGTSKLAKPGTQLPGNCTVLRVEQMRIVVRFEGRDFTIEKK